MNEKLIKQIKELPGVKAVTAISEQMPNSDNMVIVVFEPEKPVLHDEYGVSLFKGDKYWWVNVTEGMYYTFYEVNDPLSRIGEHVHFNFPHTKIFASLESAKKWIEENKPKPTPIYVDPETGDEFFEGERYHFFNKESFAICKALILQSHQALGSITDSKSYNTREKCEIALAELIANKYNYCLAGKC